MKTIRKDNQRNTAIEQTKGGAYLKLSLGPKKQKETRVVDAVTTEKNRKCLDLSQKDTKKCSIFFGKEM